MCQARRHPIPQVRPGKTYEEARQNWVNLRDQASRGPVSSSVPKLDKFLAYWLKEIVEPNLAPKTYERYEMFSRLHIIPYLGGKHLDNPGERYTAMAERARRHLPVLRTGRRHHAARGQKALLRNREMLRGNALGAQSERRT